MSGLCTNAAAMPNCSLNRSLNGWPQADILCSPGLAACRRRPLSTIFNTAARPFAATSYMNMKLAHACLLFCGILATTGRSTSFWCNAIQAAQYDKCDKLPNSEDRRRCMA